MSIKAISVHENAYHNTYIPPVTSYVTQNTGHGFAWRCVHMGTRLRLKGVRE